jgi:hypothetical protein
LSCGYQRSFISNRYTIPDTLPFELVYPVMGQRMPVRDFPAQEKWQASDTETGIRVSHQHGHTGLRFEFLDTEGGAGPRIAATDDNDVRHYAYSFKSPVRPEPGLLYPRG